VTAPKLEVGAASKLGRVDLERADIFRLLETADNFVKYAKPGDQQRAAERARDRYERALKLAQRKGDAALIEQVRLRMDDLERRDTELATSPTRGAVRPDAVSTDREISSATVEQLVVTPPHGLDRRIPPGQRVTRGWPVLHEGPIPRFDKGSWRLAVRGACAHQIEFTYEELRALPNVELDADFHCVTGWSKLENLWRGVQTKLLVHQAQAAPDASHVLVHGQHGYTANLSVDVLLDESTLLAWSHNGSDLAPEHGFPLRLLVPSLYGWKSVKWVIALELMSHDQRGFWETRGYHNRADPWREERYAYQES
jgi:DMSO/TMAO reductase YedYZ molybdopterin-dependent catalytic subunit